MIFGLAVFYVFWAGSVWAENDRPDKTFMWRVRSSSSMVYILGSIHLAKPDLYPLDVRIEEAFNQAEVLAVEADIKSTDQARVQKWILEHGFYPEGQTLVEHLSNRTKAKMAEMGFDLKSYNQVRPWLAAMTIQTMKLKALGFEENYGLDRYFLDRAARTGKPIQELEGLAYQLQLFQGLSLAEQELFLYATLMELEKIEVLLGEMLQAWKNGQAKRFETIFFQEYDRYPELIPVAEKIIFQRNRDLAAKIENLLASGRACFIVVGAGHLIGDQGIIHLLKSAGFRVEQI